MTNYGNHLSCFGPSPTHIASGRVLCSLWCVLIMWYISGLRVFRRTSDIFDEEGKKSEKNSLCWRWCRALTATLDDGYHFRNVTQLYKPSIRIIFDSVYMVVMLTAIFKGELIVLT